MDLIKGGRRGRQTHHSRLGVTNTSGYRSQQADHIKVRVMVSENWHPYAPSREASHRSAHADSYGGQWVQCGQILQLSKKNHESGLEYAIFHVFNKSIQLKEIKTL